MRRWRYLVERVQGYFLRRRIERGSQSWGRQDVKMPARASIAVKVIRADGTVEDRGVVWEGEVRRKIDGNSPN